MGILKLSLSHYGHYIHKETSSVEMCVLQYFLATDINCFIHYIPSYVEWAQNNANDIGMSGILTSLDKENGYILISHHKNIAVFLDRKSTRLNSSHMSISYAVFCLKKK